MNPPKEKKQVKHLRNQTTTTNRREGAKNKPSNHVNLVQDEGSDFEPVLLMATTSSESSSDSSWYLDFGCYTHMTEKRD